MAPALAHRRLPQLFRALLLRAPLPRALVLAVALAGLSACDKATRSEPAPATEAAAAPTAAEEAANDPSRTTFAGDWWVLCTGLPHQAFKLSLLAPKEEQTFWEGS